MLAINEINEKHLAWCLVHRLNLINDTVENISKMGPVSLRVYTELGTHTITEQINKWL